MQRRQLLDRQEKLRGYLKSLMVLIRLFDHDAHTAEHIYPVMYKIEQRLAKNEQDVPSDFRNHCLREHKRPAGSGWRYPHGILCSQPHYHEHNVLDNSPVTTGLKMVIRFFAETPDDYTRAVAQFTEFKNFFDANLFGDTALSNSFSKGF